MGLHQGELNHSYWEAESCGVANVCRSSDVFEETAILRNWSRHPFKVRGKKRWIVKTTQLQMSVFDSWAPFHRRRSALHCTGRWECGDESPPGPAETGDASSPPL